MHCGVLNRKAIQKERGVCVCVCVCVCVDDSFCWVCVCVCVCVWMTHFVVQ